MPRLPIAAAAATRVTMNGRDFLAFGGCNYLGLANHPDVLAATFRGLQSFGLSTTASRETTGNTTSHELLEFELASYIAQEACILTAEGYTANFAACQGLADVIGVALLDAHAHRSIRNAAVSAGMQVFEYEHLNPESAAWLIRQHHDAGVAIMTDSVFAADGAVAPLPDLLRLLPKSRSALLVDDCHGFCVLGEGGRGAVNHFAIDDPRVLLTTTLAKGLGCYGGAVLGRRALISRVREVAAVYRSSTPIPPALAESCRAALAVIRRESSLVPTLRRNIDLMRTELASLGIPLPPPGIPIFTFAFSSESIMQRVHDHVHAQGILAPLISYPGGPAERYFRVVVNAAHTPEDIRRLSHALSDALAATPRQADLLPT